MHAWTESHDRPDATSREHDSDAADTLRMPALDQAALLEVTNPALEDPPTLRMRAVDLQASLAAGSDPALPAARDLAAPIGLAEPVPLIEPPARAARGTSPSLAAAPEPAAEPAPAAEAAPPPQRARTRAITPAARQRPVCETVSSVPPPPRATTPAAAVLRPTIAPPRHTPVPLGAITLFLLVLQVAALWAR